MSDLPQWAQLKDPTLSQAMSEVWQRLPDHAKAHLEWVKPKIVEFSEQEARRILGKFNFARTVAFQPRDGGELQTMIMLRRGFTLPISRWGLAHEFAHIACNTHLLARMGLRVEEIELKVFGVLAEDLADYVAAREWGFMEDLQAVLAIHPQAKPRWVRE
jgi:hypothetical protein